MTSENTGYAEELASVQAATDADFCFLLVVQGNRGTGWNVTGKNEVGDAGIAGMLRLIADEIDPPAHKRVNDWLVKEYEAAEERRARGDQA